MGEIEREWQSLWDAYGRIRGPGSKIRWYETVKTVDRLFAKRLSAQRLRHLAASAEVLPVKDDVRSQFANELLAYMVKAFVGLGDRESLVGLLSKRCPSRIEGPELIEFWLAFRGERLEDPILILGEAYARCQVPETRHILAASPVHRAFADFRSTAKTTRNLSRRAMRWYAKEKDDLLVNQAYTLNETGHGGEFSINSYETRPELFDTPSTVRDPLFKRGAGLARADHFRRFLLTLLTVTASVLVAFFLRRAMAQRYGWMRLYSRLAGGIQWLYALVFGLCAVDVLIHCYHPQWSGKNIYEPAHLSLVELFFGTICAVLSLSGFIGGYGLLGLRRWVRNREITYLGVFSVGVIAVTAMLAFDIRSGPPQFASLILFSLAFGLPYVPFLFGVVGDGTGVKLLGAQGRTRP